jgi:hypothetical protein
MSKMLREAEVGAVICSSLPVPTKALPPLTNAKPPPVVPTRKNSVPEGIVGINVDEVPLAVVKDPVNVPKSIV